MKQFTRQVLMALFVMLLLPLAYIDAQTVTVNQVSYTINTSTNEAECSGCGVFTTIDNLVISEAVSYNDKIYPVTSIANGAFKNKDVSGTLTLPNSITRIGSEAFSGCNGLSGSLIIPNSVTRIGPLAFYECSGFTGSLTLSTSATIGSYAFYGCSGFSGSLIIPNSIDVISENAFSGCSGFSGTLTLPNSISEIGENAFRGCKGLTGSLILPESIINIGKYAFYGCKGFTGSLIIPNSVANIGSSAFNGCSGFTGSLIIGNSITNLESSTFYGCTGFKYLSLPGKLKKIGDSAFGEIDFLKILSEAETPPAWESTTIYYTPFSSNSLNAELLVPANSIENYKNQAGWNRFNNVINTYNLIPTSSILLSGEKVQLTASFIPEFNKNLSWKSSDENIASVSQEGLVSAIKSGTATITATTENGITGTSEITVAKLVLPSNLDMFVGDVKTLNASIQPVISPSPELVWSSSNEDCVVVNNEGEITAIKAGSATISITAADLPEFNAHCSVTVYNIDAESISFDKKFYILSSGQKTQLSATILPENTTIKTLTWKSSDENVASVSQEGLVTAIKTGTATISATTENGITATAEISVAKLVLPTNFEMYVGDVTTLKASIQPEIDPMPDLVWSSSNEDCLTVNNEGQVTALSFGSAIITASLVNYPDVTASCHVRVYESQDEIGFILDEESSGVIITEIPDVESYIIPSTITFNDDTYSVTGIQLTTNPDNLIKVAYPQGVKHNFSAKVVTVPYPSDATISSDIIISGDKLIYVSTYVRDAFEITSNIKNIGKNAFTYCSHINELSISDSSIMLIFEYGASFNSVPILKAYVGRDITYQTSPFLSNSSLAEITIGNQVSTIRTNMFSDCTGLSQVVIEDGQNPIEIENAFSGSPVDYLYIGRNFNSQVNWPTSIKAVETGRYTDNLGEFAFAYLPSLYSVTIGVGMRNIHTNAFANSNIIKVLWMPNTPPVGYESISADINYVSTNSYINLNNMVISPNLSSKFFVDGLVYVFIGQAKDRICALIDSHYNRYLTALNVPHKVSNQGIEFTVQEINDYALYSNQYFLSASVGDGIISIGNFALYNCSKIASKPYIGKSVKSIGDYAFNLCSSIPSIVIPDATEYLGKWSLANCSKLESILLGSGLEVIKEGCFANDYTLRQMVIPANVIEIGNKVFDNCSAMSYLEISDRATTLSMGYSVHNYSYSPSDGNIGGLPTAGTPLFNSCPLKKVYIGGDISYSTSPADGYSPFYRNDALEEVVISNNETEISDNEFYGCRNLKEVIVGNDVTRVGDYAFSGCISLEYFSLGRHVLTIGQDAFSDCDKMVEFKSYNPVPPVCGDQAMDDINKFNCTLFVPHTAVSTYQNAAQWENFFHIEGMDTDVIDVQTIILDPEEYELTVGETFVITATVLPADADYNKIDWSSSDIAVVTVDDFGKVTAVGNGTGIITARIGDISATCSVTVKKTVTIDNISFDDNTPVKVYNIQGSKLNVSTTEELYKLNPGLYIVIQNNRGDKILIK